MKKFMKTFVVLLLFLMLSSFAFGITDADITSNLNTFWKFDSSYSDETDNNLTLTTSGSINYVTGKIGDAINVTPGAYLGTATNTSLLDNSEFSYGCWYNFDSVANEPTLISNWDSPYTAGYELRVQNSGDIRFTVARTSGSPTYVAPTYSAGITSGNWYFVGGSFDGTDIKIIFNGNYYSSTSLSGTHGLTNQVPFIGIRDDLASGTRFDGKMDECMFSTKAWNQSELDYIYNSGDGRNITFLPPPTPGTNDSAESTALVSQTVPVTVNTPSLTTILSSSYNVTVNNTPLYGEYNFNVRSNQDNGIYCELLIDGELKANKTRTNDNGILGSISLMTEVFTQETGEHTQELRCAKIGSGNVEVTNAVGIGHFLVNEDGNFLPYVSLNLTENVFSGVGYTKIGSTNFTISNTTLLDDKYANLVVEWNAEYYNFGASETLDTYLNISGNICSNYPRTVNLNNIGSVGGDCLIENATINQTYEIDIYGKGSNARYDIKLVAKEFILSDEEISGGQGALVGLNFSGDTDTKLINVTGGNLNHGLTNVFQKQAYSILTDEDTTVTMYITLNNSVNLRTVDMTRDFTAGEVGVLIGHDIFQDVPQDNYTISVYANCGSPTATCELVGGAGIGYITDVTTTLFEGFYITAYDTVTLNPILNFSSVDGVTFTTTNGTIAYFTTEDFVNFTLVKDEYANATYINHDTSNNLDAGLTRFLEVTDLTEHYYNKNILEYTVYFPSQGKNYSTTDGSLLVDFVPTYLNESITIYSENNYNVTDEVNLTNYLSLTTYALKNKKVFIQTPEGDSQYAQCSFDGNTFPVASTNYFFSTYLVSNLEFSCLAIGEYVDSEIIVTDDNSTEILTLDRSKFILNIVDMDGVPLNVTAYLSASNEDAEITQAQSFNTSQIDYDMIDFLGDSVYIFMGKEWVNTEPTENGTVQSYQFKNTNNLQINETLYLLDAYDSLARYNILNENNKPIIDGFMRVEYFDDTDDTYKLVNRLEFNNYGYGVTGFTLQNNLSYSVQFSAPGYNPQIKFYRPGEFDPSVIQKVVMEKEEFPANQKMSIFINPLPITQANEDVTISFFGNNVERIYLYSQYIAENSDKASQVTLQAEDGSYIFNGNRTIVIEDSGTKYGSHFFYQSLENGFEYDLNNNYMLIDVYLEKTIPFGEEQYVEDLWENIGIFFKSVTGVNTYVVKSGTLNISISQIEILDPVEEINEVSNNSYLAIIGLTIIIILSVIAGLIYKTERQQTGKYVFLLGTVFLSVLLPQFTLVAITSLVYMVFKATRWGVYRE